MEASEMNLADGEYTVEVTMEGGAAGFNTVADRIDNRKRTGIRQKSSGAVLIMTI